MPDMHYEPLHVVADLLARRVVSPVELTRATLARIARLDPGLSSYLRVLPERALAAAAGAEREIAAGRRRGPLHGVPIAIKDLCDLRGEATTCAAPLAGERPAVQSATVVERLEAAGAVIVGKTNLYEYAFMGYHPGWPVPRNPWRTDVDTGGSSSGSGVAIAAGLCFAALGTDTGGSIRMPSAWCGLVGLKPTWGRVSRAGVFPLAASLDHVGPMARTVRDAALVQDVIAGPDPRDPTTLGAVPPSAAAELEAPIAGVRVGWDEGFAAAGAAGDVVTAARAALDVLAAAGAQIVPITLPPVDEVLQAWTVLCAGDALAAHAAIWPSRADAYGPSIRSFFEYGARLGAADYARAHEVRLGWRGAFAAVFGGIDVLACPSTFGPPPPAGAIDPHGVFSPDIFPFGRFTFPFDCSGSPTLSLPCGVTAEGLLHSLQLVGRHGDEALLCRVGHAYETATPWHARHPSL
ncbi:MAG: amidase [bacterium]|nr:amidase [bacterium]